METPISKHIPGECAIDSITISMISTHEKRMASTAHCAFLMRRPCWCPWHEYRKYAQQTNTNTKCPCFICYICSCLVCVLSLKCNMPLCFWRNTFDQFFPVLHVRHHEPSRTAQGDSTRVTCRTYHHIWRLCLMIVIWTGSLMNGIFLNYEYIYISSLYIYIYL